MQSRHDYSLVELVILFEVLNYSLEKEDDIGGVSTMLNKCHNHFSFCQLKDKR
jgi:hypothetical protein